MRKSKTMMAFSLFLALLALASCAAFSIGGEYSTDTLHNAEHFPFCLPISLESLLGEPFLPGQSDPARRDEVLLLLNIENAFGRLLVDNFDFIDNADVIISYLGRPASMASSVETNRNISYDEASKLLDFVYSKFTDLPRGRITLICIRNMELIADEGIIFPS